MILYHSVRFCQSFCAVSCNFSRQTKTPDGLICREFCITYSIFCYQNTILVVIDTHFFRFYNKCRGVGRIKNNYTAFFLHAIPYATTLCIESFFCCQINKFSLPNTQRNVSNHTKTPQFGFFCLPKDKHGSVNACLPIFAEVGFAESIRGLGVFAVEDTRYDKHNHRHRVGHKVYQLHLRKVDTRNE